MAARKEGQDVDKVLVWRRRPGQYASQTPMVEGRDFFVDEVLAEHAGKTGIQPGLHARRGAIVPHVHQRHHRTAQGLRAQHRRLPLLRGQHIEVLQDIHPDDMYWCMADIGWITGHSYIVYGPLALGTTSVIYEGTPNYPDAGRPGGSRSGSG